MPANIYITIDVECIQNRNGIIETIFCESGQREHGVNLIMDTLDEFGHTGIFFCDTTMHYLLGENYARQVYQAIHNRGHQVQLHIHPMHAFRSGQDTGLNLSREQWNDNIGRLPENAQDYFIREGVNEIYKHTGKKPDAFRAGNYGARLSTLPLLKKHGIEYDSSYNLWTRKSNNDYELMFDEEVNSPFMIDGLVELPATVFYIGDHRQNRYRFFAPEGASLTEMRQALDKLERTGIRDIVIVLHSFTFIKFAHEARKKLLFNRLAYTRFRKLLRTIQSDDRFRVTTFSSIDKSRLPVYPDIGEMKKIEISPFTSSLRNLQQLVNRLPF